jgi:hypothetical protein
MQVLINLGPKGPKWNRQSRVLGDAIRYVLEGVVRVNQFYMRLHHVPSLYSSGVRYQEEPEGTVEEFATIPVVLKRKWGDCDDLAPWRCAELRETGENAHIRIIWKKSRITGRRMYHVVVRRADGTIEDPSARLGMHTSSNSQPTAKAIAQARAAVIRGLFSR